MTALGFKYGDAFFQFMKIARDRNITYRVHKMNRCAFIDQYELTLGDDADVVGLLDDLRALGWRIDFYGEITETSTVDVDAGPVYVAGDMRQIVLGFPVRGRSVLEHLEHASGGVA